MNLSIQSKEENHLLGRQDVHFNVEFESAIPSREQVRSALSTAMSVAPAHVVVVRLDGAFGVHTAKGIAHVSLETGLPVLFGIITADTMEQAIERAGTKGGNKGRDAALNAIEMVNLLETI